MVTMGVTYAKIDFLLSHLPFGSDLSVKLVVYRIAVFPKIRLGVLQDVECTEIGLSTSARAGQ